MKYSVSNISTVASLGVQSSLDIYGNVWGLVFYCDGAVCSNVNGTLPTGATFDWSKPISWDDAAANAGSEFNNVTSLTRCSY